MLFEWDIYKNLANISKHGISFEEAISVFEGIVFTSTSCGQDYGELRHISIGELEERLVIVVVHTQRGERTRIISARKASNKERKRYYEHLKEAIKGDCAD